MVSCGTSLPAGRLILYARYRKEWVFRYDSPQDASTSDSARGHELSRVYRVARRNASRGRLWVGEPCATSAGLTRRNVGEDDDEAARDNGRRGHSSPIDRPACLATGDRSATRRVPEVVRPDFWSLCRHRRWLLHRPP